MPCHLLLTCQMIEENKALVIQKYARAWLARRRFQTMRRLVLNVQLSFRVQQLKKKIEEQVKIISVILSVFLSIYLEDVTLCDFLCPDRIRGALG